MNLATFVVPVIAGLVLHATVAVSGLGSHAPAYYLLVFAAFIVSMTGNFLGVFVYGCYLDGSRLVEAARSRHAGDVSPAVLRDAHDGCGVRGPRAGPPGSQLVVLVLLIFQYLIGELLRSKQRGEQLQRVATTDELTGLANRERFRAHLDRRIGEAREAARSSR